MPTTGSFVGSYIRGDDDPSEFDFSAYIERSALLELYKSSGIVEKICKWLPEQALDAGWKFDIDEMFTAEKFSKPYPFKSFTDWFNWCGAYEEFLKGIAWTKLLRRVIIVGFLANEQPGKYEYSEKGEKRIAKIYGVIKPGDDIVTSVRAYYPFTGNCGFKIEKVDNFREAEIYKIYFMDAETDYEDASKTNEQVIFFVHKSRVIELRGFQKELGLKGNCELETTAHLSVIHRQLTRAIFNQAKNLSAGVKVFRAKTEDEANYMKERLESFNHLRSIAYAGDEDLDQVVKIVVPDLNADQMEKFNLMLMKEIAAFANISIRNFGEEDIASGLGEGGAGVSTTLIKAELRSIQRRFRKPLEQLFYLMGKKDSSFTWNEPMLKDEKMAQEQNKDEQDQGGSKWGEGEKEPQKAKVQ